MRTSPMKVNPMRTSLMTWLDRFHKRDVIGMDLGKGSVKLVQLQRGKDGTVFKQRYLYDHPTPSEPTAVAALRAFLRKNHLLSLPVACNIEHESLKIHKVDLPWMDTSDLKEAVVWKMREVVEGPVEDYVIRPCLLEEYTVGEVKRLSLIAYAIKRQVVQERQELLRQLGLKPVLIEPTSVSLTAALEQLIAWPQGKPGSGKIYALLDMGKGHTTLMVMAAGKLLFSQPLPGFAIGDMEKNNASDFYTQMAVEIQRSLDAFSLLFGNQRIGTLWLCGGGAALPELSLHLATSLGITTEVIHNPFLQWGGPREEGYLYVTATGLALYHSGD